MNRTENDDLNLQSDWEIRAWRRLPDHIFSIHAINAADYRLSFIHVLGIVCAHNLRGTWRRKAPAKVNQLK